MSIATKAEETGSPPLPPILIVSITPYFLQKGRIWFEKNFEKIQALAKTQPWWQNNCIFLKQGQIIPLSSLVQKLSDMGYEKVQTLTFPGEFAWKGNLVEIFPINLGKALRLEFFGNQVETIKELGLQTLEEEKVRRVLEQKLKSQKLFSGLKELKPGDYIVHSDHGTAKYLGTGNFQFSIFSPSGEKSPAELGIFNFQSNSNLQFLNGEKRNYYILEYAEGDKLYVPLELEKKLSRYVGFVEPKISRLGSQAWQKTKRKIKQEVERFAKELLQIYAKREASSRLPYFQDNEILKELSSTFPYQETPDQLKALQDIEKDLQEPRPMDRLLCGDVGFGKTEIALRTMVMAASEGKTALLICPTTILASQHFQNFKERLKNLPVNLALLTRIQTDKEQKEIIEKTKQGKIDILLGTHRLLSRDMAEALFEKPKKELGLLIIDDEQKFGVRQKEKLKKLRANIDILSLSATPIPRTLYLALSSLREISFIQTPPPGRLAIKTFILPWSKDIIRKAIEKELSRKGQIYYLHNRVQTIGKAKAFLQDLAAKAKIGVVHGRIKEKELVKTMADFQKGSLDLLLATTIIENGLDLPNVNTLIVEDASRLGLAQAYQIRGRVGRFTNQAFAYFLHPQKLSLIAKERLKALKEARALGSGWKVAIKDLEIRGAGNILGKEQSGSINQIGLNLYCQMLSEAVTKFKS